MCGHENLTKPTTVMLVQEFCTVEFIQLFFLCDMGVLKCLFYSLIYLLLLLGFIYTANNDEYIRIGLLTFPASATPNFINTSPLLLFSMMVTIIIIDIRIIIMCCSFPIILIDISIIDDEHDK